MKKFEKNLLWILLIYILVRLPLVLFPFKGLPPDGLIIVMDRYIGALAMEIMEGLKFPLWDYVEAPYGGGPLLQALWVVPFFKFFGGSLFALKFAAVAWYFFTLILWYFVFRRNLSEKQTFFSLLFLVLAPPRLAECMIQSIGFHCETITWVALSILIFSKFLEEKLSQPKASLTLGILGGFSTTLLFSNVLTAVSILIYVALLKESPFRKFIFYRNYLFAFLIGFSPAIAYNIYFGWGFVLDFFTPMLQTHFDFKELLHDSIWTFRHSLRLLLDFPLLPNFLRRFFRDGMTLTYLFSLFYLFWLRKKSFFHLKVFDIQIFGLIFQILLFIVFVKQGDMDAPRYLIYMIPFIGMTMVCSVSHLAKSLRLALVILFVLAGLLGQITLMMHRYPVLANTLQGYSYSSLVGILCRNAWKKPKLFQEKFNILARGKALLIQEEMARIVDLGSFGFQFPQDSSKILEFIGGIEEKLQPIWYEKLGREYGPEVAKLDIPLKFQPALYRGFIQTLGLGGGKFLDIFSRGLEFCNQAPQTAMSACYKGLGLMEGGLSCQERFDVHADVLSWLDKNYLFDYLKGTGEYSNMNMDIDLKYVKDFLETLNPKEREAFLQGFLEGIDKEEDPYQQLEMRERFGALSP